MDCPGQSPALEAHTISWLPATLDIQPLRFPVEPGVNLGLHESLRYALDNHEWVSLWGPYECRPSFFRRFLIHKGFLDSGRIGYQCCDDCVEAEPVAHSFSSGAISPVLERLAPCTGCAPFLGRIRSCIALQCPQGPLKLCGDTFAFLVDRHTLRG